METSNIFRLAAVLYADINYNVKRESIIKKIIDTVFLNNCNNKCTIYEISDFCAKEYGINIAESEIADIIFSKYEKHYNISRDNTGQIRINLTIERFNNVLDKDKNNNISNFIEKFIKDANIEDTEFGRKTILKFIYELFTSNLNSFKFILNGNKDISDFSIDYKEYDLEEKKIINQFLNYKDAKKNKAIFDIANYALEYCLVTGNNNALYIEGLKNKKLYLDTNIIYRALGINGAERKERTRSFLKKCYEVGQELRISKYTDIEFQESIDFYIKQISKYSINGKVHPSVYEHYAGGYDIYLYYYEWKSRQINNNLELFRAHIKSQYEQFKKEFNVFIDYKSQLDENNPKMREIINQYSESMEKYKLKSVNNIYDAKNIALIREKRIKKSKNFYKFLDTPYYFISTDQKLRDWNYENLSEEVPIIILPSQWFNILLRYVSRTNDDFRSFVSFLNMKQNYPTIDSDKLHIILSGIGEITEIIEQQEYFAKVLIEDKINDIILEENDDIVYEKTKEYVKSTLDKELERVVKELENTKQELSSACEQIKKLDDITNENNKYNNKIIELTKENQKIINTIINKEVEEDIRIWKIKAITLIPVQIIIILIGIFEFFFSDWKFNFIYKFFSWIDTQKDWIKNIVYGINYAFLIGLSWLIICTIYKRLISRKHVESYKNELIKEYTEKWAKIRKIDINF
ncbi:MAG TPA: hypothetical protein PLQ41_04400 [bacterium]|nr:hypothetical protein [bacterium]